MIKPGDRVLIHDDLLATGGTALAAAQLVKSIGGDVAGFGFIIELSDLKGREKLNNYKMKKGVFAFLMVLVSTKMGPLNCVRVLLPK